VAVGSDPAIGAELGGYRLEALVGRGGMSAVYRAEDLRLGRPVALKVLAPELAEDERFRARFLAESRLAASIDHPNIVPIFEAGEADGRLYIAMRYVEGTDLRALLRSDGPLEPGRAVALVGQLAEALDAAHARGLVHRDVKPSNALVTAKGASEHVYLADFGLTKHTTSRGGPTAHDQMVGTVEYVAPEQIRGDDVDGHADLYALGCVLFESLTGEVPFSRRSEVATIYAHLEDDPPRASDRRPGVPAEFDAVIARALAKDPKRRWQHGAELTAAAQAALPTAARAPKRWHVSPGRHRGALALALSGMAAAVAATAGVLVATRSDGGGTPRAIDANAVAVIDPAKTAFAAPIPLDSPPSQMAAGYGAVWATNADEQTVTRIDLAKRTVRQTIPVGNGADAIAVGEHGVWVVNSLDGTVSWISPVSNREVTRIPVGNRPSAVCVAGGAVWVTNADDRDVVRIDAARGRVTRTIGLDDPPTGLACGGGSVWVSSEPSGSVVQIRADSGDEVGTISTGRGTSAIAYGAKAVWVTNTLVGTVSKIDPLRGSVVDTVQLRAGDGPAGIAIGRDGVWVSNELSGTLARVDPRTGRIVKRLSVGNRPHAVAVVGDSVWVGLSASGAGHRGGTLRILTAQTFPAGAFDPVNAGSILLAQVLGLTNDGLTALRRTSGIEGEGLVPDLAVSLPTPTNGGRTYTFQLRPGIRYSNGVAVRPSDIRRQLERVARLSLGPTDFYAPILGEHACAKRPATCNLAKGIEVDDRAGTITFNLRAPDPDFLYKLALPLAVAVPPGTPLRPTNRLLPATGPYTIVRYEPGRLLTLARNPRFRSSATKPDGFADAITIRFGIDERAAVKEVETGAADWVSGAVATDRRKEVDELFTRYAGQVHANPQSATVFFFLNTRVPPFNNLDARRAVNFAVDRRRAVAIEGGQRAATLATCQILPPNFPVYRRYCPYTVHAASGRPWSAADLVKARRLVARSGTKGMRVKVWSPTPFLVPEARFVRGVLTRLGYRASLRVRVSRTYWPYIQDSRHRAQIGPIIWAADYPAPSDFLWSQFSCPAFLSRTPGQVNWSEFCDPVADRLMRRARQAERSDASRAADLWSRAERRVVDRAAALPLTNPGTVDVLSTRVGNYHYNPEWGILLDQLWVR
jgi:ABC-type transport system substrate-binding protein